jgi:hypothetical protein
MSRQKYQENCRGCRPAMLDLSTGRPLASSAPEMQLIKRIYAALTLDEKKAWHRFTCLNSREAGDLTVAAKFKAALERVLVN